MLGTTCCARGIRARQRTCAIFFFQAEDGIRDYKVTGVQTCALPILSETRRVHPHDDERDELMRRPRTAVGVARGLIAVVVTARQQGEQLGLLALARSEERRVGKEGRSRWSPDPLKKKKRVSCARGSR